MTFCVNCYMHPSTIRLLNLNKLWLISSASFAAHLYSESVVTYMSVWTDVVAVAELHRPQNLMPYIC